MGDAAIRSQREAMVDKQLVQTNKVDELKQYLP